MHSTEVSIAGPETIIHWFRRDLRVVDNPALRAAVDHARRERLRVLPLFVVDPALVRPSGRNRLAYLRACLQALTDNGVPLAVRDGDPAEALAAVAREFRAAAVYCCADFGPYGRRRDDAVADRLQRDGCTLHRVGSPYVVAPGTVRQDEGSPYRVFTPFRRKWEQCILDGRIDARPVARVDPRRVPWLFPASLRETTDPVAIGRTALPGWTTDVSLPVASERAAAARLSAFVRQHLDGYPSGRNDPGLDATSRLSPDLRWGVLHARTVLAHTDPLDSAHAVFRSELCWREFYADVLWHRPDSARRSLQSRMDQMRVDDGLLADERYAAWCEGRTGYPLVDAGMRQLRAQGWMHNRVRMVAASFLVKHLHLPWQRGARFFMSQLIDGDLASNQHGWQWTAGTGTDAAPYFRVFNPIAQAQRFDPDGTYLRRWLPELDELAELDERAELDESSPEHGLHRLGARGRYPGPIVDHTAERAEALARFAELRPSPR